MDRGAWQATVHGVTESWTRLSMHALMFTPCTALDLVSDRKKQALAGWRALGRPSQSSHELTNKFIKHCVQPVIASESRSLMSDCLRPQGLYSPWDSPGQNTGVPSPGHLPNPGIKPRSPALQADSLPAEPPGKPT